MSRFNGVLLMGCAALLVASCSTIKPKRITSSNETSAVGLRYYETRPFLVVRKPYPIASVPYLVHGVLSNDGKSFFVTNAPDELKLPPWTNLSIGQFLPQDTRGGGNPGAQGEAGDSTTPEANAEKPEEKPGTAGGSSACEKEDCKDTTGQRLGFSSISLETDLTGTAIVPINELFSIIYLPDYDREFYVESQARWGMSKLHITRGPGGTLLAYNSEVDNSAVIKPLYDALGTLITAGTKAAVIKIEPKAKAQGERVDGTRTTTLTPQGTATTLRIHVVKFAVPGAYPFIKPDEVAKWSANPTASGTRILVPSLPYQIPYDYFTVLIAEHLLDPPGTSALVSNVTAQVGPPGEAGGEAGGSGGSAASRGTAKCQKDHGLPAVTYSATVANRLLPKDEADPDIQKSIVELTTEPGTPADCAGILHIKFTGDASRKEKIEAALKKAFPKVELDVTPQ